MNIALEFGQCHKRPNQPAVSVNLARATSGAANGAALAVLAEMPAFVRAETGSVGHVVADVCTENGRSLALLRRAGWKRVGSDRCDYHHRHFECRFSTAVFCFQP